MGLGNAEKTEMGLGFEKKAAGNGSLGKAFCSPVPGLGTGKGFFVVLYRDWETGSSKLLGAGIGISI